MGKVIHWKLYNRSKFDHSFKWYRYKPEFVQENETHKIIGDFEKQTDYLIQTKGSDVELISEKIKITYHLINFAISVDHRVKIDESEKIN